MKRLISRLLSLVMMMSLGAISAYAAVDFPTDGSALTLGTVYTVKEYSSVNATIKATKSGKLLQDGCGSLEISGINRQYVGYGTYGQVFSYDVEAGKTYTITSDFVMSGGRVKFQMEDEIGLTVVNVSPREGNVISTIDRLEISFNTLYTYTSAKMTVNGKTVDISDEAALHNTNTLVLYTNVAMAELYERGILSEEGGETIEIVISGLKTLGGVQYNSNGKLNLKYIASPKLTELVSVKMPDQLMSYYPKGDPNAICKFVFDRDIINNGSVTFTISCGNPELDLYVENIKPVIEGNTVTVDLAGKMRELATYCSQQGSDYVSIRLDNVFSVNGVGSGTLANPNAYTFVLPYGDIPVKNVVSEFNPRSGSSLVDVNEIEIWFNNADVVQFSGVEFLYDGVLGEYKSLVIENDKLSIERSDNEVTILVPVPAEMKTMPNVTLRLYQMESLDGFDHGIAAVYNLNLQGISSIGAENGANTPVYNLHGVKVLEGSESVNSLPNGIYICGNKKIIVR